MGRKLFSIFPVVEHTVAAYASPVFKPVFLNFRPLTWQREVAANSCVRSCLAVLECQVQGVVFWRFLFCCFCFCFFMGSVFTKLARVCRLLQNSSSRVLKQKATKKGLCCCVCLILIELAVFQINFSRIITKVCFTLQYFNIVFSQSTIL